MEPVGFSIERQERLLRSVEGRVAVAHHSQGDRKHPVFMGPHQFVERLLIAVEKAVEELDISVHGENRTSNTNE